MSIELHPRGKPDPRRELWLRVCGIDLENADDRGRMQVCSKHFRKQDYKPNSLRLYPSVIPTLNVPNPHLIDQWMDGV